MYGALLGDMIGAPYEFDRGNKSKKFPLFCELSRFTDDSVMTIAVAEALLDSRFLGDDSIRAALIKSMRKWGKKYPDAGYGRKFLCWLREKDPKPYGSCGNGSAMRVSAAGWLFDTLEETREKAKLTAEVTHDHPEGIKGAEATSSAIFLARTGRSKGEIRDYIVQEFGYDLSRTCDQIRPSYCLSGGDGFRRCHPDCRFPRRRLRYPDLHRREHRGGLLRRARHPEGRVQAPAPGGYGVYSRPL